jgi:predicted DNA-binding transcriptional regulator YafY
MTALYTTPPIAPLWLNGVSLEAAIKAGRSVAFDYVKADGTFTRRIIDPIELVPTRDGHVIVRAYDQTRGEYRSFRLDRITQVRTTWTPQDDALARIRAEIALIDPCGYRNDAATWRPEPELSADLEVDDDGYYNPYDDPYRS